MTHYRRTGRFEAHIWISGKDAESFVREGRGAGEGEGEEGGEGSSMRRRKSNSSSGGGGSSIDDASGGAQQKEMKRSRGFQLHLVRVFFSFFFGLPGVFERCSS